MSPAPDEERRPSEHEQREAVLEVETPHDRLELSDRLEDRLVTPVEEVLEGLPQRSPSEGIEERDRAGYCENHPEPRARRRRAPAIPRALGEQRVDPEHSDHREPEVVREVRVGPY